MRRSSQCVHAGAFRNLPSAFQPNHVVTRHAKVAVSLLRDVGRLSVVSLLIGVAFSNLTILLLLGGGAAAGTLMVARRAALAIDSGGAPRNLRMPVCCASRAMVVIALKGDVPFQFFVRCRKAHLLAQPARARWR